MQRMLYVSRLKFMQEVSEMVTITQKNN